MKGSVSTEKKKRTVTDIKTYIMLCLAGIILLLIILVLQRYSLHTVKVQESEAKIHINFLVPMDTRIEDSLKVEPAIPGTRFAYQIKWQGSSQLVIEIKELDEVKGQHVKVRIRNAKTKIPLLAKSISIPVQFQADPMVIDITPTDNTPTAGPIQITFNTPMDTKSVEKYIETDMVARIEPVQKRHNQTTYTDYSKWRLYPSHSLRNESNYILIIRKGLRAQNGRILKEDTEKQIRTVSKPEIIKTFPEDEAEWVSIYPRIIGQVDEEIKEGAVEIEGIEGTLKINKQKIEFLPKEILKPDTIYTVKMQVRSMKGESSEIHQFSFKTMPITKDTIWVEVSLKENHEVIIHKGDQVIRRMPASGGLPDQPTVLGTFYLGDRGYEFFSERFGEGATHWVRIIDQYLFHGIPRDREWKIIEEELHKLGRAASHGCIRLSEEDAKWFYDNMPRNTMVIIHE